MKRGEPVVISLSTLGTHMAVEGLDFVEKLLKLNSAIFASTSTACVL